jgi:hypothetical protein
MSWYSQLQPTTPMKRYFYCAVCKSPYERFTRGNTAEHCKSPSLYLGEGEEGLYKARQMKQKKIMPLHDLIPPGI